MSTTFVERLREECSDFQEQRKQASEYEAVASAAVKLAVITDIAELYARRHNLTETLINSVLDKFEEDKDRSIRSITWISTSELENRAVFYAMREASYFFESRGFGCNLAESHAGYEECTDGIRLAAKVEPTAEWTSYLVVAKPKNLN